MAADNIISNFTIPGEYTVQLSVNDTKSHWYVTYGLQTKVFAFPSDALTEFHHCINHAATCASWLDSED